MAAILTDMVKFDIENSVLCWLATVDEDGAPSVSPKEIFTHRDGDRLIVADIASPGSVRNILANPLVCISFVDIFRQRGFKVKGRASVHVAGSVGYVENLEHLRRLSGSDYQIRSVIEVVADKITRIWAPSYLVYPNFSEAERLERGYATYGVTPMGG
jgi:uncharacterized protein